MELLVVCAILAVGFGAYKTGALTKIYSGILGKVDVFADKIKDPIAEMQLKQAKLVDYSAQIASHATEISGKASSSVVAKQQLQAEVDSLRGDYSRRLEALKQKYPEGEIPGAEAKVLMTKKEIITMKESSIMNLDTRKVTLDEQFEKLRSELMVANSQLELIRQLIDSAKLDREILNFRKSEIRDILHSELDVNQFINDIKKQSADMAGQAAATEVLKKDLSGAETSPASVSVSSLEL